MSPAHSARSRRDPPSALVLAPPTLAALVELCLRHCGVTTEAVADAQVARAALARDGVDLLVMDMTLRGASALLAETARLSTLAMIDLERGGSSFESFAVGADQVVRLPFTPDEIAVRAGALLRRRGVAMQFSRAQLVDGIELDLDERARLGARTVTLGASQNSLLYLLAANADRPVARDDVRRLAWGIDRRATDAALDRAVKALARSLGGRIGEQIEVSKAGVALNLKA